MLERKDWSSDFEALVNRAFDEFPFFGESQFPRLAHYATPPMDVYEKDGKYKLDVSIPGYEAKDIDVEVKGSTVTVSGSHKEAEEKKGARFYRREARIGTFMRSVTLPQDLDPENVDATLDKGVLTLTLTPLKPIEAKKIPIKG